MSTTNVDKQIDSYLSQLSITQKKAVLMVVKTIAVAHQEYDNIWHDKEFVKEMDKRTAEYENGTAKLYKFEDMKKKAVANYKAKSNRKK
jgi:tryptophan synthase beta subunit